MKNFLQQSLVLVLLLTLLTVASSPEEAVRKKPIASLKGVFENDFLLGSILDLSDEILAGLVTRHFAAVTPEDALKWTPIHPEEGTYNFGPADDLADFALANGLSLIGHTLIWHERTPTWVFADATREILLERMEGHISSVVGRYQGKVQGWDVVNEAIDGGGLRQSEFQQIVGDDYIEKAFEFAYAADPNVELYYNDWGMVDATKRARVIQLIQDLQGAGIRIDGVGIQAHWRLDYPTLQEIEITIEEFAATGVKVMITELDIDVLPGGRAYAGQHISELSPKLQAELDPYAERIPRKVLYEQAKRYEDLFRLFREHSDKISRVTFWGAYDGPTWLNNYPVRGRTNYPLLFERKGLPKPSFFALAAFSSVPLDLTRPDKPVLVAP